MCCSYFVRQQSEPKEVQISCGSELSTSVGDLKPTARRRNAFEALPCPPSASSRLPAPSSTPLVQPLLYTLFSALSPSRLSLDQSTAPSRASAASPHLDALCLSPCAPASNLSMPAAVSTGYVPPFATTAAATASTAATKTTQTSLSFAQIGTATGTATAAIVDSTGGVDSSSLLSYFTRVRLPFLSSASVDGRRTTPLTSACCSPTSTPTHSRFPHGVTPTSSGSSSSSSSSSGQPRTISLVSGAEDEGEEGLRWVLGFASIRSGGFRGVAKSSGMWKARRWGKGGVEFGGPVRLMRRWRRSWV